MHLPKLHDQPYNQLTKHICVHFLFPLIINNRPLPQLSWIVSVSFFLYLSRTAQFLLIYEQVVEHGCCFM
jgi:hypothetical protein